MTNLTSAIIVDAVRTPIGRRAGSLSSWHPVDLAAEVLRALVARNDLDPSLIDDVLMGCVTQTGPQSLNIGRNAALAAGFPESVPGVTIDRQCGSSQQAAAFAAQGIMAGFYDIVIAAGVEHMTSVPMTSRAANALQYGESLTARYEERGGMVELGIAAERLAASAGLDRDTLDGYSLSSHRKAALAEDSGRFVNEIVPLLRDAQGNECAIQRDEGIRRDASPESLAALKPAFVSGGRTTAGNSSSITDGAAGLLLMSEERATQLGMTPRARLHSFALAGTNPIDLLTAPAPATTRVLERAGLGIGDIDLFEVNEAFAAVVLSWANTLHVDLDRVNVNGGAIALGHPLGASGARLTATLVNELERTNTRYGLQVMCEAGGMANATIIERLG